MVTKDDLLKELESKAVRVFPLEKHTEVNGRDYYQFYRYYWIDGNDVIRSEAVCIHVVVDENGNEHAYWKDRVPTILTRPTSTFTDEIENLLTQKQQEIGYVAYDVEAVNDRRQIARVILYFENQDGTLNEKKYLVWKDSSGKLQYKRLV